MIRGRARHYVSRDLDTKIMIKRGVGSEVSFAFCIYAFGYVHTVELLGRWFAP